MEKMPDGNTAALRQHEAAEAKAEAIWDAYAERAIDDFVERMLAGDTVKIHGENFAAQDFMSGYAGTCAGVEVMIGEEDLASLLVGNPARREEATERLRGDLEGYIREWLQSSTVAQDWVMERCREWNEDDQQRHGETD